MAQGLAYGAQCTPGGHFTCVPQPSAWSPPVMPTLAHSGRESSPEMTEEKLEPSPRTKTLYTTENLELKWTWLSAQYPLPPPPLVALVPVSFEASPPPPQSPATGLSLGQSPLKLGS